MADRLEGSRRLFTRREFRGARRRRLALAALAATMVGRQAAATPFAYTPGGAIIDTATDTLVGGVSGIINITGGVAMNPAGTRVYMKDAGFLGGNGLKVVNTATNSVIATVSTASQYGGVAVHPSGTPVYATSSSNSDILVIDATTNTVVATIPAGGTGVNAIAVHPDGSRVYVTRDGALAVIDTATNSVVATVTQPAFFGQPGAVAVNPSGTRVYASFYNNFAGQPRISIIDTATNTEVGSIPLVWGAGIAINPAGTRMYAVGADFGLGFFGVRVIDLATNTIVASIGGLDQPAAVAVNPAGTKVYVIQRNSSGTAVIDAATNTVTTTVVSYNNDSAGIGLFVGPFCPGACSDSNPCTDDICNPVSGACSYTNNSAPCDDGTFCNGPDTCSGGACVLNAGNPCAGGPECADSCNEALDNCFEPATTACTSDGNVCTDDHCNGAGACVHPNNTASCDDGQFCNGADTCSGGFCNLHAGDPCAGGPECAATCNEAADNCIAPSTTACTSDGNVCTDDHCSGAGACIHPNNSAPCSDGTFCNGADTCGGGSCSVHAGNPCVGGPECADACNEGADNCFEPSGTACTADGNVCTDDQCNGTGSCTHPNNTASCDDGLFCNGTDTCAAGTCTHAGNPCTGGGECADTCNEAADNCFDASGTPCAPDTNQCSLDECDGAGACTHPDKPNGSACADGDPCTTGETCTSGACGGGAPNPAGCIDHFLCYKAKPFQIIIATLDLVDQFETMTAVAQKPTDICAPANKNGEGVHDPVTHQVAYQLKPLTTHVPQTDLTVTDQFGTLHVDTIKPFRLLVPTSVYFDPPPLPPPAPGVADHYKCYKIKITPGAPRFPRGVQASVVDQFQSRLYDIKKPQLLCNPVDKNGEGIEHPLAHLMCYRARVAKDQPKTARVLGIGINNQIFQTDLDLIKEDMLCVPATKTP